ncbi:hypothetical protein KGF57_003787 [Candida theae]|uniref:Methyltransferase type 11 domain-containing protein n=1 Tax=Candida theae TaxID=1198502 RepID=A0AAD5FXH3_9ASCO|nr:uncharacterized protein KGF57_003787 [Candida theae]KAI5954764.1 hypothetical protein KGF57_003787 [Candida theae]
MSTYSETSFNSQHYDDARPNYPEPFYLELIKYHKQKGVTQLAIDIGCGSGFVAFKLLDYFDNVVGTDPSSTMISHCQSNTPKLPKGKSIEFIIGSAESHPNKILPSSVDLITGAECCHWVDHEKFYTESARVLKPNGTLAYWLYKDPVFVGYPKANEIYENYTYNSSKKRSPQDEFERYMGPYYQQPGHDYLRSLLKEKSPPKDLFYDISRHEYVSERDGAPSETEDAYVTKTPLFIRKVIDMKWFLNYVRSWSAYHTWMKEHGDKYDIAEVFVDELKNAMGWDYDTKIEVIWDTVYTFARKK